MKLRVAARAPWLKGRRHGFVVLLWAIALVLAVALEGAEFGYKVDQVLFLRPMLALRRALDFEPRAAEKLRVVVFDDSSLDRLGRLPTAAEWNQVAGILKDFGYREIFFHGALLGQEPVASGRDPLLTLTAVDIAQKVRGAVASKELPRDWILPELAHEGLGTSRYLLTPSPGLWGAARRVGVINMAADDRMPLGFHVEHSGFIPNAALWAADSVQLSPSKVKLGDKTFPSPVDGMINIDFLPPAAILKQALPVRYFFDEGGVVRNPAPAEAQRRIAGGEVAILVPEGYSGTRFLESTLDGKVPAYVGFASLVSGVLHGRLVLRSVRPAPYLAACLLTLLLLLGATKRRWAALVATTAVFVHYGATAWLFLGDGRLFPTGAVTGAALILIVCRGLFDFHATSVAKARVDAELDLGSKVQGFLFPKDFDGRIGPWEYHIFHAPYGPMSGDWLQVAERSGEGPVEGAVAIGDVVGKGASAALITAVLAAVWKSFGDGWTGGNPAETLLARLHDVTAATFGGLQHSTIALAVLGRDYLEVTTVGTLAWSRWRPGTEAQGIRRRATNPLGSSAPFAPEVARVEPAVGEVFWACTDGVIESRSSLRTLHRILAAKSETEVPTDYARWLFGLATATGKDHALPDDKTMVVLRYLGTADARREAS